MSKIHRTFTNDLASLLAPTTIEQFRHTFWQRACLHVSGDASRFSEFMSAGVFDQMVAENLAEFLVIEARGENEPKERWPVGTSHPRDLLERGYDLHAMSFENLRERWRELVCSVKAELGFLGDVSLVAIYSQHNEPVDFHFDGRGVFNMQIFGEKVWSVEPHVALQWPRRYGQASSQDFHQLVMEDWQREVYENRAHISKAKTFTMTPGDLVYVPSGLWHAVPQTTKSPSLSLLITMEPESMSSVYSAMLEEKLIHKPSFRAVPLALVNDEHACRGSIEQLRAAAQQVEVDLLQREMVRKLAHSDYETSIARGEAVHDFDKASRFVHSYHSPVYALEQEEDAERFITIYHGPHEVDFSAQDPLSVVEFLVEHRSFTLDECLRAVDAPRDSVVEVLQLLCEVNLLVPLR